MKTGNQVEFPRPGAGKRSSGRLTLRSILV